MNNEPCYLIKSNAAGLGMLADGIHALTQLGAFPDENYKLIALEIARKMRQTVGDIDGDFSLEFYECKQDFDAVSFVAFLAASAVEESDISQSSLDQIFGAFEDARSSGEF